MKINSLLLSIILLFTILWWPCCLAKNTSHLIVDQNNATVVLLMNSTDKDNHLERTFIINDGLNNVNKINSDRIDEIVPKRWTEQTFDWKFIITHCLLFTFIIAMAMIFFTIYVVVFFHYIKQNKIDYHVIIPMNDF